MGLLSPTVSITRYLVKGTLSGSVTETFINSLKKKTIPDIDKSSQERAVGWTSFESPFLPDFDNHSPVMGSYFIFSLRIDKKNIPDKIIKKYFICEMKKKLSEAGREFLSNNEKKLLKENIKNKLCFSIPATPNMYDVVWNYEKSVLFFFSNTKNSNEEFETLFGKTFNMSLVRLFPYTIADLTSDFTDQDKDELNKLGPTNFIG